MLCPQLVSLLLKVHAVLERNEEELVLQSGIFPVGWKRLSNVRLNGKVKVCEEDVFRIAGCSPRMKKLAVRTFSLGKLDFLAFARRFDGLMQKFPLVKVCSFGEFY